jgi:hypothetical protein
MSAESDLGGAYLPDAGASSSDAGYVGCLASNECPAGYICNEFNRCEKQEIPTGDGGMPPPAPEVEYDFGAPISSQRYV